MRRDRQEEIHQFNEELDHVATGVERAVTWTGELDMAAAHAQLQALDSTPDPDSAFVNRLKEDLMHTATIALGERPRHTVNGSLNQPLPSRAAPVNQRAAARFSHRFIAMTLAAAIVLASLGAGFFGFGIGRPDSRSQPAKSGAFASASTPIPAPIVSAERTLAEYDIPASALTPGIAGSAVSHFIIPASSTSTWTVPAEASVAYVLDGALTLTSDKPIEVRRAASGGAIETTPVGTPVNIVVGDAVLLGSSAITTFVNQASTPVLTLQWGMSVGTGSAPPFPGSWNPDVYDLSGAGAVSVPEGGAHIRLWQVELGPNQQLKAPKNTVLQLAICFTPTANGAMVPSLFFRRDADGSLFNLGKDPVTVYVATLTSTGAVGGSPVAASPTS